MGGETGEKGGREMRGTKWEDRQRLERQGDEIVDMIRRHEEEEEEKRRQAEGMSARDEYRMMLVMAEKQARDKKEERRQGKRLLWRWKK